MSIADKTKEMEHSFAYVYVISIPDGTERGFDAHYKWQVSREQFEEDQRQMIRFKCRDEGGMQMIGAYRLTLGWEVPHSRIDSAIAICTQYLRGEIDLANAQALGEKLQKQD